MKKDLSLLTLTLMESLTFLKRKIDVFCCKLRVVTCYCCSTFAPLLLHCFAVLLLLFIYYCHNLVVKILGGGGVDIPGPPPPPPPSTKPCTLTLCAAHTYSLTMLNITYSSAYAPAHTHTHNTHTHTLTHTHTHTHTHTITHSPAVESKNMRFQLLNEQRELIGPTRAFDGSILFLPRKITEKVLLL